MDITKEQLASMIDSTYLKPTGDVSLIDNLCDEAMRYHFASVCVNGSWVKRCAKRLKGSGVKVCAVIDFPLGQGAQFAKQTELFTAAQNGAQEIDFVQNVMYVKSGMWEELSTEYRLLHMLAEGDGLTDKVILETGSLTDEEKKKCCELAKKHHLAFVKTSTGFGPGGATAEDVALMRRTVGPDMGVKAAGGIRTTEDALRMIAAGATRIGTSHAAAIVDGLSRIG